ncbi:uncharacterized protein [Parasteatoda tepidariorum]|uniref:uncharacterized protein n=1 Tax=Parasteatoda tepidariorum TaxID=114398 RepID=UPI0039BD6AEB
MEEREDHSGKRKRHGDTVSKTLKMDSTQDDDFVNYFSEPPSLQHISAVSIAIRLWMEPEIKKEIITSYLSDIDVSEILEERILCKLSSIYLPASLKTEVSYVVRPIMLQLLKEFNSYCTCTGYHKNLCEYMKGGTIHWTVEGTVDIMKSLMELFDKENSDNDICHLYEAACFYCLEKYIPVLWKKVPAEMKSQFRIGRIGDVYKHHMVIYWTSVFENSLDCFLNKVIRIDYENIYDHNLGIDLNMITCSIRIGSKFALKYFWKKLGEQEKIANLDKWLLQATPGIRRIQNSVCQKYDESLDVLCFLLSRISDKLSLAEYFQNHSHVLMVLFESWPFQRIFLPTVLELLDYLHDEVYVSIMKDIGSTVSEEGIERKIFQKIWNASPSSLKRSFLQKKVTCAEVILNFLELKNLSLSLMLLNDASEEEVKQIICYLFGWHKFCYFLYSNELNLLCTLLSETTLPPECNLYTFRCDFEDGIQTSEWYNEWHICHEWLKKGNFQTVEMFLKWAFQSADEVQDFKKNKLDPYIMYVTFIVMRNYELLERFLNWYFDNDAEIQQFKKDFLHDDNNSHFKFLLCELRTKPSTARDALEKFVSYCSPSPEEINELKCICHNYVETILQKRCYEFATVLLNWSLNSMDDVKRYKNDFVLSEKGIKKFIFLKKLRTTDMDWKNMEDLIKWSLPLSKETIAELKSLIQTREPFYPCESGSNLKVIALLDSVTEY